MATEYVFSDLFELQMGKTPSRSESSYWQDGNNPWISIADFPANSKYITSTKESISDYAVNKSGIKLIPKNTVIMSFKLSIGKVAITPEAMYSNEAIMAFIDKKKKEILPDYLFYLLKQKKWNEATNKAVMGRTLNKATLSTIRLKLHSSEQQRKIVQIFDNIYSLLGSYRKQLRKLDDLAKARFVEMFGDECETVLLSEVAEVTGGLTKNSKRNQFPIKLPYLRVANVFYNSIDTSEMLEIGLTTGERDKTLLQYGDLLFVEGNGSPEQIGRVAVWRDNVVPCVHQNHLIKARFVGDKVLPEFAMYYFMTPKGREQIKRKAVSTSGLYTLSVSKVAGFTLPQPLFNQQKAFAAFAAQIDKSKEAVQQALDKTQQLFDSLMQQYFA